MSSMVCVSTNAPAPNALFADTATEYVTPATRLPNVTDVARVTAVCIDNLPSLLFNVTEYVSGIPDADGCHVAVNSSTPV